MNHSKSGFKPLHAVLSAAIAAASLPAIAENESMLEEIVVKGDLRSLPGENVESVFGFGKSLLETPRSASTISSELIERFAIDDIDELIVLAPGTFTQSFFGVAGSLDIRGTAGENYFRGIRRLDNPGNYPTPIGATERVDIVRGPASPIMGPSKIGGYLNFVPKSARADGGAYLAETEGAISYTAGSWDKSVVTAEVGGPAELAGREFGYYLYAELEDSDSFYENSATDQTILQASFDMDLTDRLRLQWGGMYHDFSGNQIAGWNRLTQDLIDNGTYITGDPQPGLDVNGDGAVSHQEHDINGDGFTGDLNPFAPSITPGQPTTIDEVFAFGDLSLLALDPATVGTAQLRPDQVLVAPEDRLLNETYTLYFDIVYSMDNGVEIKNQLFYETYENLNENAYGFSQFADSYVIEDRIVASGEFASSDFVTSWQLSPSLRYTDFERGQDYVNEYFDRRDLTGAYTPDSRRRLSTQIDGDYTEYNEGNYLNLGMAALVDITHSSGLELLLGARWDWLDLEGSTPLDKMLLGTPFAFCTTYTPDCFPLEASDTVDGWSWTASLSYGTDFGLRPYITASTQSTVIASQGADITATNIQVGGAFDESDLLEAGVKGSFLDDRLYMALSVYRQERVDFSAQDIVTNQSAETEGLEFETRWAVTDQLLITLGYSRIEVTNLAIEDNGQTFSFVGAEDLPNVPGELLFGGVIGANVQLGNRDARRAGIPEDIFSATATYDFGNGLAVNASVVDVEEVASGFSNSVELPAYTLLNLGAVYESEDWLFSLTVNNVTDEEYFRANFPELFGSAIALPELPRNVSARVRYNF